jgi:hypothetical protein
MSGSPAETIRDAATAMRAEAQYLTSRIGDTLTAVAEWLDSRASDAGDAAQQADGTWSYRWCDDPAGIEAALKIARIFLGAPKTEESR